MARTPSELWMSGPLPDDEDAITNPCKTRTDIGAKY